MNSQVLDLLNLLNLYIVNEVLCSKKDLLVTLRYSHFKGLNFIIQRSSHSCSVLIPFCRVIENESLCTEERHLHTTLKWT